MFGTLPLNNTAPDKPVWQKQAASDSRSKAKAGMTLKIATGRGPLPAQNLGIANNSLYQSDWETLPEHANASAAQQTEFQ